MLITVRPKDTTCHQWSERGCGSTGLWVTEPSPAGTVHVWIRRPKTSFLSFGVQSRHVAPHNNSSSSANKPKALQILPQSGLLLEHCWVFIQSQSSQDGVYDPSYFWPHITQNLTQFLHHFTWIKWAWLLLPFLLNNCMLSTLILHISAAHEEVC